MEGTNPVRVGVGLTNLLGWGAEAEWFNFTPNKRAVAIALAIA